MSINAGGRSFWNKWSQISTARPGKTASSNFLCALSSLKSHNKYSTLLGTASKESWIHSVWHNASLSRFEPTRQKKKTKSPPALCSVIHMDSVSFMFLALHSSTLQTWELPQRLLSRSQAPRLKEVMLWAHYYLNYTHQCTIWQRGAAENVYKGRMLTLFEWHKELWFVFLFFSFFRESK